MLLFKDADGTYYPSALELQDFISADPPLPEKTPQVMPHKNMTLIASTT